MKVAGVGGDPVTRDPVTGLGAQAHRGHQVTGSQPESRMTPQETVGTDEA
jgi:hypothetical protein